MQRMVEREEAMKLLLLIATSSCASIPVSINRNTTLKQGVISDTYLMAQEMFASRTPCSPPKDVPLIIKDATLLELNHGNSVFTSSGIYIIVGKYETETHTISIATEHPDRVRVLFHEALHFMIVESNDCFLYMPEPIQHALIRSIEEDYFKQTKRVRVIPFDWVYDALRSYGF
jgi:hypothetical protein